MKVCPKCSTQSELSAAFCGNKACGILLPSDSSEPGSAPISAAPPTQSHSPSALASDRPCPSCHTPNAYNASFCGSCGNSIVVITAPHRAAFCPSCGTATAPGQPCSTYGCSSHTAPTSNTSEISKSLVLKILAACLMICFFLPFGVLSCAGQTAEISGFSLSTDLENGSPLVLALLAFPLAMLIVQIVSSVPYARFIQAGLAAGTIISALITRAAIIDAARGNFGAIQYEDRIGFYAYLILGAVAISIALLWKEHPDGTPFTFAEMKNNIMS